MKEQLSRRSALRAGAGLLAGVGAVGQASANAGTPVRVNVGYAAESGRGVVERAATSVIWEFSFDTVTALVPEGHLSELAARSDVSYVERDARVETVDSIPSGQDLPWGIDRVDAEAAHESGSTGNGAHVAIVDTGVDRTHTDLQVGEGVTTIGGTIEGYGQDDNGHGTHCAGVATAKSNGQGVVGVAPGATVHGVKALPAGGVGFASDVAAALEYVADQGWDVANMSLSGARNETLREACQSAYKRGVLLVAAAGNTGGSVQAPANYGTVMGVSATNKNNQRAAFSASGNGAEISAPGVRIYSTYLGGYATLDGTSMAAPHVAGAGALLMAQGASNGDARTTLTSTADPVTNIEPLLAVEDAVGGSGDGGNGSGSPGIAGTGFGLDAGV